MAEGIQETKKKLAGKRKKRGFKLEDILEEEEEVKPTEESSKRVKDK